LKRAIASDPSNHGDARILRLTIFPDKTCQGFFDSLNVMRQRLARRRREATPLDSPLHAKVGRHLCDTNALAFQS
jgi:hypothetical protein